MKSNISIKRIFCFTLFCLIHIGIGGGEQTVGGLSSGYTLVNCDGPDVTPRKDSLLKQLINFLEKLYISKEMTIM